MSNMIRIVGPPGTGKTHRLGQGVRRAVALSSASEVYVASLTKAAAREIAERSIPLAQGNVGTLHHHAFQALGNPEMVMGKEAEWNDATTIAHWKLSVKEKRSGDDGMDTAEEAPPEETDGDLTRGRLDILRARMVPRDDWPIDVYEFDEAWAKWKRESGYMDFTDLIETALQDVDRLHNAHAFVVDEAQDNSRLEMALCRKWGGACETFAVAGDADQAIFSWRGADPAAFWEGEARTEVLEQSYRVPRAVHAEAVRWIERSHDRVPVSYLPRDADGRVVHSGASIWEGREVANMIERHLVAGQTVMLLATCGYMLGEAIRALRDAGIPFHNPARRSNMRWNPLWTSKGTASKDRLLALLHAHEPDRFWRPREVLAWAGAVKGMPKRITEWLKGLPQEGELTPTQLLALPEAFHEWPYLQDEYLLDEFEGALLAGREKGMAFPLQVARRRGAQALAESPRVLVGTVHSFKGWEADVAILAPDLSAPAWNEWTAGGASRDAVRRVFYVGMTRARDELVLLSGGGRSVEW